MDMRAFLARELERRRERNPRYSCRAFARSLQTDHGTLSRILRARCRLTPRMIRRLGSRLGWTTAGIHEACTTEHCASIRQLVRDSRFRPDSRWIAIMSGIPLDEVNVALQRLLYRRELVMAAPDRWTISEVPDVPSRDPLADRHTRS